MLVFLLRNFAIIIGAGAETVSADWRRLLNLMDE